jgi:beta-alanine degradation protein BauB
MVRPRWTASCAVMWLLLAQTPSRSQDRAAAVPDMRVLVQNDGVRVQFHDVAPGETTPMHSHPAYVAYVFNAYTGESILADGSRQPLKRKPGEVFYSGPVTHRLVNIGATPIHNPDRRAEGSAAVASARASGPRGSAAAKLFSRRPSSGRILLPIGEISRIEWRPRRHGAGQLGRPCSC